LPRARCPVGDQGDPARGEAHPDDGVGPLQEVFAELGHDSPNCEGHRQRGQPGSPPGKLGAFAGKSGGCGCAFNPLHRHQYLGFRARERLDGGSGAAEVLADDLTKSILESP
jgi:hypothetical protein